MGLSRKALRGRCIAGDGDENRRIITSACVCGMGRNCCETPRCRFSQIATASGFETLAGFSRSVRNNLGVSPSAVRKMASCGAHGFEIRVILSVQNRKSAGFPRRFCGWV